MSFFNIFSKKENTADIAKSRLQLVLFQDRLNTYPETLEMLKADILGVLNNYLDFEEGEIDINLDLSGNDDKGCDKPVLSANIPIRGWKKR
ncbi:MAG: cell division topological specificity factor MinE [Defluviitaleaceae bacterium]|nr:cell division topological specificity factor MinE [Defluviitaleaceae bacterium]